MRVERRWFFRLLAGLIPGLASAGQEKEIDKIRATDGYDVMTPAPRILGVEIPTDLDETDEFIIFRTIGPDGDKEHKIPWYGLHYALHYGHLNHLWPSSKLVAGHSHGIQSGKRHDE
ncbi:MAG TPA: hypothetical protein VNL17_14520 [Verrucomicrobiae bacterium]|nr:hypothetical protein [Verrucomicrobiae bacterium]